MATEPMIYSQSWINSDCTFAVSSGSGDAALAYDRDKNSQWESSGAASDGTPVTFEVDFPVSQTIDTIILINHNILNYTVAYWNGSSFVTFITQTADASQSALVNASPYGNTPIALAAFSPIMTTKLLFTFNSTQTANQEKKVGELIACNTIINPGQDLAVYEIQPRVKQKVKVLGDGSIQYATVFWSPTQSQKYEAQVGWTTLPYTLLDAFVALRQLGAPFLWYPESITRPDDIFYVNWDDAIRWKYSSFYKFSGIDLTMFLREV